MVSIFGDANRTTSAAIREAANLLSAGDILLIEVHYPGPKNNYQERDDQDGYIAVEWWADEFVAIQYAVGRGVIVVEAAGNGAQDLDAAIYETRDPRFPPAWKNPFRRSNRDSGAILVGAGAPPPGTHNRTLFGPNLSRLDFSNYGSSVDAQGWGREVTTCGYGDLQGGGDENRWYTDQFSGTSSASPIVVGALACLQGIRRARGAPLLTPASARALLRATGSPQQPGPGAPITQRIGNRPDLKALVAALDTIS
jgi:subtilisin family serine protease